MNSERWQDHDSSLVELAYRAPLPQGIPHSLDLLLLGTPIPGTEQQEELEVMLYLHLSLVDLLDLLVCSLKLLRAHGLVEMVVIEAPDTSVEKIDDHQELDRGIVMVVVFHPLEKMLLAY